MDIAEAQRDSHLCCSNRPMHATFVRLYWCGTNHCQPDHRVIVIFSMSTSEGGSAHKGDKGCLEFQVVSGCFHKKTDSRYA